MLKVVHLTYDMRIGGTETVIKNIIDGFTNNNDFQMEVLCIEPKLGPFGEQLQEQGVKVTNLHWTGGFDLKLIKRIRAHIKENNVEVLHCHQYTPWVYGAIAAAFTNVKVIFTEHGRFYPDSSSWKRKYINPVLLRITDHVTAISKATKQALVDFEFIPGHRIEVIYNGIKPLVADEQKMMELKDHWGIPEKAKIVGTVARLDPIKNQTMMIKAFAMALKDCPNTYLLIIGDGEERGKLEILVDNLLIRKNVIFTGYVAKPVNHIALMDMFLLSSLSEGTSMTLLEAMSLGKPCIVTDAGGNKEIISGNDHGIVVENDNMEAFSSAILDLLTASQRCNSISENNLKRFHSHFSCETMTTSFAEIYMKEELGNIN